MLVRIALNVLSQSVCCNDSDQGHSLLGKRRKKASLVISSWERNEHPTSSQSGEDLGEL